MMDYREQVADALRAVEVTSPTSYAWFGTGPRPLPRAVAAALPAATSRGYLVDALQHELYRSFYCQGRPVPARADRAVPTRADGAFVRALSEANTGVGGWEPGWRVERLEPGIAQVGRNGLTVRARISDCCGGLEAGSPVSLRRPKELTATSPGFYMALGDTEPADGRDDVEVRVYFNASPAGAAPLVAECTRLLNRAHIAFSLKVLDNPTAFARCDAAVLYLDAGGFDRARASLPAIVTACAIHLRAELPAFTKPLAFGVSVGEHHPGLGGSFGSSRCRLVAEGIVAAHDRGERRLADRLDAVARRFADDGIDLEVPYLAPASSDRYAL
jgi:HopA1 effector protein family